MGTFSKLDTPPDLMHNGGPGIGGEPPEPDRWKHGHGRQADPL